MCPLNFTKYSSSLREVYSILINPLTTFCKHVWRKRIEPPLFRYLLHSWMQALSCTREIEFFFFYSYFHFGFLNLFPTRKFFYSQCDACKHYVPGESFDPFYARELDGFKDQARFPWSLYIFPAIVGFWIMEAIVRALF